jgi:electron transfer flavoprotein alpha subunit
MSKILVYIALQDGKPKRSSLEVLSEGYRLCSASGSVLEAVVLHSCSEESLDHIGTYGASRIYVPGSPILPEYLNRGLISAMASVIGHSDPSVVLFASTEEVKDMLGALAVRVGASALTDVSTISIEADGVEVMRPVMAARRVARMRSESFPVLVSVRSGSFEAASVGGSSDVQTFDFEFDASSLLQQLRETVTSGGQAVDLSEADVVVAAGRGVKDEEGKILVQELAGLLNGAIGASRAVVESGLFPATAQIGQTGKVVSPELYFAIGISGAIQHVAGMTNSRVIVAINKDPDAPIFSYSTYGLVGDLYRILPILIRELKAVVGAS